MERKKLILLLSAAGLVLLIASGILIASGVRYVRGQETPTPVKVRELTLCDLDASGLCVVSFGADNRNQMVINFELPRAKFPVFYALVEYGDTSETYSCQVVKEIPTSAYCSGPRTPLGGQIHIKVFRVDGDKLLAEGDFVVSAIALPTLPSLVIGVEDSTPTPFDFVPGATPTATPTPFRFRITPTLPTGYPNN